MFTPQTEGPGSAQKHVNAGLPAVALRANPLTLTLLNTAEVSGLGYGLKVLCAPKSFSGRLSYSTCSNDFGAATYNERRFQFRLVSRLFRVLPGFMGKSLVIAVKSSTNATTKLALMYLSKANLHMAVT